MSEVGIECLRTGDGEDHRRHDDERTEAVAGNELNGVDRVEASERTGVENHLVQPKTADHDEPDERDGAKNLANKVGPAELDHKQQDQDDDGSGHRKLSKIGIDGLQAFGC